MELDDGRWLLLTVPPTSIPALEQWTARWMHLPVKISAQKTHVTERSVVYLMGFDAVDDPREQADLVLLAALTTSTQAQQHLMNALKMIIKGQKRILRRAQEALSSRSGLTETEIKARIAKILGRDGGGKP